MTIFSPASFTGTTGTKVSGRIYDGPLDQWMKGADIVVDGIPFGCREN